VPYQR
jgi:NAD(P)H-nitrite reductase large subunit